MLTDLNNVLTCEGGVVYIAGNTATNRPPIDNRGVYADLNVWSYWHRKDQRWGIQFAQNWHGGGFWCRDVNANTFGDWTQIVRTGMRTFGRIFIDANNEPTNLNGPYLSLSVGDSDTGFNRGGNGVFGVVCDGVNTLRFDAQSVIVRPEASKVYGSATVRNTVIATLDPSGGNDGDIWLKYV